MNAEKTGKYIAECRRRKQLTQAQLAELLHVSDKAVSRWETGRGFPDVNSLEDIAAVLDIGVAELIRGERIEEHVPAEEANALAEDTVSLAKTFLQKRKVQNFLTGLLISLIVVILAAVHLNSPVRLSDPESFIHVETLQDGRIIAVVEEPIAGWELEHVSDPEDQSPYTFLSCYRTLFSTWTGRDSEPLILLGSEDTAGYVYYYPGKDTDVMLYPYLLYPERKTDQWGGVRTLPRLIYNAWLFIGLIASVICCTAAFLLRKTRWSRIACKAAGLPVSFVLSNILVLWGKRTEVYNAMYYLSGILIMTILLYLLFLAGYSRYRRKQRT